ncbi:MAG TPA: GDSL-type esterase/lipase family protein [Opitutaceae bacterium]|nr:GDSL-type esterase/lipase family protein [Opitutaceae bacterium]
MRFRPAFFRALALGLGLSASAFAAEGNTAVQPEPRDAAWVKRHEGFVEIAKAGGVDVLFLGDSITDGWRRVGKVLWDEHFAPLRSANFGIGGDRTQHVLWRMQNGELDGIAPKVVVLMIGTNNTGFERDKVTPRNTVPETVGGVTAVVEGLRAKLPEAKILLLAIFPRGEKDSPQRAQVAEVNAAIARLDDGKAVRFLDINAKFLWPDGTLPRDFMPDLLHPNEVGYAIWAAAIKQPLAELLR